MPRATQTDLLPKTVWVHHRRNDRTTCSTWIGRWCLEPTQVWWRKKNCWCDGRHGDESWTGFFIFFPRAYTGRSAAKDGMGPPPAKRQNDGQYLNRTMMPRGYPGWSAANDGMGPPSAKRQNDGQYLNRAMLRAYPGDLLPRTVWVLRRTTETTCIISIGQCLEPTQAAYPSSLWTKPREVKIRTRGRSLRTTIAYSRMVISDGTSGWTK